MSNTITIKSGATYTVHRDLFEHNEALEAKVRELEERYEHPCEFCDKKPDDCKCFDYEESKSLGQLLAEGDGE